MNTVTIIRGTDDTVETIGTLKAIRARDNHVFTCETLELPWKNNQHDISCIPKGTYYCSIRPFFSKDRYELMNVPDRTGIFIHEGNYYHDVLGCILLGIKPSDINHDGQIDVTASVATITAFMTFMQNEPFTLTIE